MWKSAQDSPWLAHACVLAAICTVVVLSGCAQGNSSADLAPAAPQPAVAQPASPPPPANAAQQPAPAAPVQQVAMTPEKAKGDCWMKYENDKRVKNIDARLALVEKCVDETLRNQPPRR